MASKILSIEIGQGLTRVVEMDYNSKSPKIYSNFSFETPQDVVTDGIASVNETFVALFKAECAKRDIRTRDAVFSVTSTRITNREVKIPQVKEKKIYETIMANASDYFPVDLTQYHLIPGDPEKVDTATEKQWKLNLMAVPNELTNSYFPFAESLGLNLVALDFVGNSVYQVVKGSYPLGLNVVLKVDERSTLITFLKDGRIDFQRIISYGIEDAINVVRDSSVYGENLSYADAIRVLCGKTCIRRYLNPEESYLEAEDTDRETTNVRIEITESLRYLVGNIARVFEYYLSRNEGQRIDNVALVGLGSDFSGMSKLLSNELNLSVRVFTGIQNVIMGRTSEESLSISTYAACIGAGMAPLNLIPAEQLKHAKGGKKAAMAASAGMVKENAVTVGTTILLIGVLLSLLMGGYALIRYGVARGEKKDIEKHIAAMQEEGVETVYLEYTNVLELNTRLTEIYDKTRSRNEDLVAFIEELEQKMPSSLKVLNFTATTSGVTMTVECDTKEAAAKTLLQLRTFKSIEIVNTAGLTDSGSLSGIQEETPVVSFTVDCVYAPVEKPEESAAETSAAAASPAETQAVQ